jgi:integrase
MPRKSQQPLPSSDRGIRGIAAGEKRIEYPDQTVRGLYLRVYTSGQKSWLVRCGIRGRKGQVVMMLDSYPRMGLADARRAANEVLVVAARGEDPRGERKAPAPTLSFLAVGEEWLEGKAGRAEKTVREYRRILESDLAHLHKREIDSIRRAELVALVRKIHKKAPVMANRVVNVIRQVFAYAADVEYIPDSPAATVKRLHQEKPLPRPYTVEELATFWRLTYDLAPVMGATFRMRALTLCRRRTVLEMRWDQLCPGLDASGDPATVLAGHEDGWWKIPGTSTKAGRNFEVPITPEILAELRELYTFSGDGEWVFPGATGHLVATSRSRGQLKRWIVAEMASFKTANFHGLRDTGATWLERNGCPFRVLQRTLDHAPRDITGRAYAGYRFEDEHREWLSKWTRHVLEVGEGVHEQS